MAAVIEQTLPHVFIYGVRAVEPDGVGLVNFNNAIAAQTFDAKQMPRDFGQPALLNW